MHYIIGKRDGLATVHFLNLKGVLWKILEANWQSRPSHGDHNLPLLRLS